MAKQKRSETDRAPQGQTAHVMKLAGNPLVTVHIAFAGSMFEQINIPLGDPGGGATALLKAYQDYLAGSATQRWYRFKWSNQISWPNESEEILIDFQTVCGIRVHTQKTRRSTPRQTS